MLPIINFKTGAQGVAVACVVLLIIFAIIGAIAWPYIINTWLVFFDKAPVITWWEGAILGFCPILGQVTIPGVVITWILMLFLR